MDICDRYLHVKSGVEFNVVDVRHFAGDELYVLRSDDDSQEAHVARVDMLRALEYNIFIEVK